VTTTAVQAAEFLERRAAAMTRLMFAYIGNAEAGGRDLPVGEFIRHDRDRLLVTLATEMLYPLDSTGLRAHVTEALTVDRHRSWRDLAAEDVAETVAGYRDQLRFRLVDLFAETRPGRGDLR
jgi:hypothetical protein